MRTAEIYRTGGNRHGAIGIELQGVAARHAARGPEPYGNAPSMVFRFRLVPASLLLDALDHLAQVSRVIQCPNDRAIPNLQGILFADGQRVESQTRGQHIHVRFHRKDDLWTPGSTIGPARRLVGIHRAGIHLEVRHIVGASQTPRHAFAEVVACGNVVGAVTKVGTRLPRHQRAILHDAGFKLNHRRAPWCGAEKILVALVRDLDGSTTFLGQ